MFQSCLQLRSNKSTFVGVMLLIFMLAGCATSTTTPRATDITRELDLEKWDCTPTGNGEEWLCAPSGEEGDAGQVSVMQQPTAVPVDTAPPPAIEPDPAPSIDPDPAPTNNNELSQQHEPPSAVQDVAQPTEEDVSETPQVTLFEPEPDSNASSEFEWLMLDVEENLDYVRSLPVSFYIIQVAAFGSFEHALKYQEDHPNFSFRSVEVNSRNGVFHVMLLGAHPTYSQAQREVDAVSDTFKNPRPWIRTVESLIQSLH